MSKPYQLVCSLLPRRSISRQAKSNQPTAAKLRRRRLFESLEPRVVLTTLAWYPLDEISGTVAADNSGNGHNGVVTGGAWADGQLGGAIEFNADGNISVPATVFGAVNQEVSFAFWAYGGDTQPVNNSVLYGVNAAGDRVFNVHLPFSNGKVYWDAGQAAGYDRILKTADPLIHKDSWHHWVFTKNATTGNMNIYLDGASWASGTGKSKSMAGVTALTLGANTNGSEGYDGRLDDVRIYDHELTSTEVLDLFTNTSSPNTEEVLVTNSALAAIENSATVITSANLQSTDAEQSASALTYTITSLPTGGSVLRAGATLGLHETFTQDDINNSLVSYDHAGGSAADSFTFVVNDGFGSTTAGTFVIVTNTTANSLAELRALGTAVNNTIVSLSTTGGDPHPVTGIVTPGEYWINGDHYVDPTNSEPIFIELGGTNNTYNLAGTIINLDTRKLDGFGRSLGHGSGVRVVKVSGEGNTVNDLTVTGHDLATDTDPNAQRHADWAAVYVQMVGSNNTIDGANILTRGSDPYGYSDVFGKGARQDPQGWPPGPALDGNGDPVGNGLGLPWIAHRKTSAFQVIDTVNAVINDMHLDVKTYGHGFFVQGTADNTTLTNSTVTGELFSSNDVIATQLYQDYGFTSHGNVLPPDIMISGNEDGVRMYNGPTGLTVSNVVVTNMRTGFSVALGKGTMILDNVEAYGTENAFNFRSNTTITNAKGDIKHGPLLHTPYDNASNTSIQIELVGGVPEGVDWAVAYVAGDNLDITIDSSVTAGVLPQDSLVRFGHVFFDNWRDAKNPTGPEDHGSNRYDYINSTFHNNTNQVMVLGNEVTGNNGSSQAGVITNGKENHYDGISLIPAGNRTVLEHIAGLGNNGTAADGSLETNASVVTDGGTLELLAGIRIVDEKLTITGNGVDGKGALYTDGDGARFGSSNGGDESTIFLDGDASIGVGGADNQLLVGRIQGTGDLTKLGTGKLSVEKSSNLDGNLIVAEGHVTGRSNVVRHDLTVAAGASISAISNNTFNTQGDVHLDGLLDLNSRTDNSTLPSKVGRLLGSGQVVATNPFAGAGANLEVAFGSGEANFTGVIANTVSLTKSDVGTQILSGNNNYTGTTTVNGGLLQVDGTHTGGGDYSINSGGTLAGNGSVGSVVMIGTGGRLSPGASAGTLSIDDVTLSSGSFFYVELGGTAAGSEYDRLIADSAMLGGALSISLLNSSEAPYQPLPTDTFTVLMSDTNLLGMFENVASGTRLETLGGEGTFLVTYGGPSNTVLLSDFVLGDTYDFGDAPLSYGTLVDSDGAWHVGVGPRLGALRDLENDGQPNVNADGDGDDEDGVMFGNIKLGNTMAAVNIELQNAVEARADAWLDFDGNGVWDAGDQILDNVQIFAGLQTINFDIPADIVAGDTVARVRISTDGDLTFNGLAADGEVEDYLVNIIPNGTPTIDDIQINGGSQHRNSLTEIVVSFDMEVTAPDSAFSIKDRDSNVVLDSLTVNTSTVAGKTVSVLTFAHPGNLVTERASGVHSLVDGNYQLDFDATQIVPIGGGPALAGDVNFGDREADAFYRFLGDNDGDRDSDIADLGQFGLTFRKDSTMPGFNPDFDFDGDLDVDISDLAEFGVRFRNQLLF